MSWRRVAILAGLVSVVATLHFAVPSGPHRWHWLHLALQKLHYLPILLAAGWFGLRGSLPVAAAVTAAFAAHVVIDWRGDVMAQADQAAEIGNLWLVAGVAGWLMGRIRRALDGIRRAHEETLGALASSLELRERATAGHSERVRDYALLLAEALGLDARAREDLALGALLHDVGKIGTPDSILLKEGPLTADEWEVMRRHPDQGAELVGAIEFLEGARRLIRAHHERWDGKGYPRGLRGEVIPLGARIFAVADAFDALTADRPYHRAAPVEEAAEAIAKEAGRQFDPAVVEIFRRIPAERWSEIARRHGVLLELREYLGAAAR